MYSNKITYSGGSPLTTSFADTSAQVLISSAPCGGIVLILNTTNDVLAVTFGKYKKGDVPSSTLPGTSYFVPAAPSGATSALVIDRIKVSQGDKVFVRAVNTQQTSGSIYISII